MKSKNFFLIAAFSMTFILLAFQNCKYTGRDGVSIHLFSAAAPYSFHQVGEMGELGDVGDLGEFNSWKKSFRSWKVYSNSASGYLTYGPYTTEIQNGVFTAFFRLRVDNNSADNANIGSIDVVDSLTGTILAQRAFYRKDFLKPMVYQDFDVTFETAGRNKLEFRIFYNGYSYLEHAGTGVRKISNNTHVFSFDANSAQNYHQLGQAKGADWVSFADQKSGFLTYGPYTTVVPTGISTATFELVSDSKNTDREALIRLEINSVKENKIIATRLIKLSDFLNPGQIQQFDLVFEISRPSTLEFRVWTNGKAAFLHKKTVIRADRTTLDKLWNSTAHFEFTNQNAFSTATVYEANTSSLVVLDGFWFAFNRQAIVRTGCKESYQTVVRYSKNQGASWSEPSIVASPTGSGPDACAIVDGGAFFDTETDTWHLLSQCLGKTGGWNLCHYSKEGISPMGQFSAHVANPVVRGGDLWKQICAGSSKDCSTAMNDEGTPQIVFKDQGYYYVTFHGAEYASAKVIGARGIARTKDFLNWEVTMPGWRGNAILSAKDCNTWGFAWNAGGCIGIGNAQAIRSNGFNYILAEAADNSLICKEGQNWVVGLFRSPSWAESGGWESYSQNPFIVNLNRSPVGCAIQYMTMIRDRGDIFLNFGLYTPQFAFPNYIYKLVPGRGASQLLVK